MKKILSTLLILSLLNSCVENTQEPEDLKSTIAGMITATDGDVIPPAMTAYVYHSEDASYEEIDIDINKDGSFQLDLAIEQSESVALYTAEVGTQVIITPGDSLYFKTSTDFKNIEFLADNGINGPLDNYRANSPLDNILNQEQNMDVTSYDRLLDSASVVLKEYNNDFLQNHDNALLTELITAEELFFIPAQKLMFTMFSEAGLQNLQDKDFMKEVNELAEFKPNYRLNSNYPTMVLSYYDYYLGALSPINDEANRNQAFIDGLKAMKGNEYLKQQLTHRKAVKSLEDNNIEFYEAHEKDIMKFVNEPAHIAVITGKYNEAKNLLDNPELSEGIELLEFNTSNPEEYIDEIIVNANGKVVYIDNWATWCGPCKSEFKNASGELHEKFKNEVEFVYLCHQSKEPAYLPTLSKYQIKGKHYFLTQEESVPIFKQIELEGFPTYTIINKNGEIVLSDYIHRPSYEKTSEILTELINE